MKWATNIGFAAAAAAHQATIQPRFGWHLARGTNDVGALLPDTGSEAKRIGTIFELRWAFSGELIKRIEEPYGYVCRTVYG